MRRILRLFGRTVKTKPRTVRFRTHILSRVARPSSAWAGVFRCNRVARDSGVVLEISKICHFARSEKSAFLDLPLKAVRNNNG